MIFPAESMGRLETELSNFKTTAFPPNVFTSKVLVAGITGPKAIGVDGLSFDLANISAPGIHIKPGNLPASSDILTGKCIRFRRAAKNHE